MSHIPHLLRQMGETHAHYLSRRDRRAIAPPISWRIPGNGRRTHQTGSDLPGRRRAQRLGFGYRETRRIDTTGTAARQRRFVIHFWEFARIRST